MDSLTFDPQGFPQDPPPEGQLRLWLQDGVLTGRVGSGAPTTIRGFSPIPVAFSQSITPAFVAGSVQKIATLTNNTTINAPSGALVDQQEITFRFQQDATGGRTITWNPIYLFGVTIPDSSIPTDANAIFYIKFRYDSDLGKLVSFAFNQVR